MEMDLQQRTFGLRLLDDVPENRAVPFDLGLQHRRALLPEIRSGRVEPRRWRVDRALPGVVEGWVVPHHVRLYLEYARQPPLVSCSTAVR